MGQLGHKDLCSVVEDKGRRVPGRKELGLEEHKESFVVAVVVVGKA